MMMSIIEGDEKKYYFGVELQSRELNLVLRKTAKLSLQEDSSCKSTVRISKFFGEILKTMSNVILQLIFSIDGDYNNLRN